VELAVVQLDEKQRKSEVAGSIPYRVIGIFHRYSLSGSTVGNGVDLNFKRSIFWVVKAAGEWG
jgi:hypothetical protein